MICAQKISYRHTSLNCSCTCVAGAKAKPTWICSTTLNVSEGANKRTTSVRNDGAMPLRGRMRHCCEVVGNNVARDSPSLALTAPAEKRNGKNTISSVLYTAQVQAMYKPMRAPRFELHDVYYMQHAHGRGSIFETASPRGGDDIILL